MNPCDPVTTIKEYMREQGITYRKLADMTGRSPQGVWNILNGKSGNLSDSPKGSREPTFGSIMGLTRALGMGISITREDCGITPETILNARELSAIPFSTVQAALKAAGYSLTVTAPGF